MRRLFVTTILALAIAGCASGGAVTVTAPAITPAGQPFSGTLRDRLADETLQGKADLDGDGVDDCCRATPNRGGGFRGVTLTVRPSCTGAMMTLSSMHHVLDLVTALPVPLAWRSHPKILEGSLAMLYGMEAVRVSKHVPGAGLPIAEGLAPWLLEAAARAGGGAGAPSAERPFDAIETFSVGWIPGLPTLPTPQVVALIAEDPAQHRALFGERVAPQTPEAAAAGAPWALILMHARPHAQPVAVATCGDWTYYSTGHGLAAHDRETDRHAWIYAPLRGAQPRHASLRQVACHQDLVMVEPLGPPEARRVLVLRAESGRMGSIPLAAEDRWWVHAPGDELQKTGAVFGLDGLRQQLSAPAP